MNAAQNINIDQSVITNGCLQILYMSGHNDSNEPLKIYTEYMDIILVLEGQIKLKVFNKSKTLNEGDLFFSTHSSYSEITHDENPFSYVRLRFLKDKLDGRVPTKRFAASLLGCDIIKQKILNHSLSFLEFIEEDRKEIPEKEALFIHKENMEILSILETMVAQEHENLEVIPNKVKANDLIIRAVDFFEHNIEENIRIHDVSKELNVSHSYFIRIFKKKLGVVPNIFWRTMKLNRSLSLMSLGADSLSDISYMLGFSDQSHFTNNFKKFLHVTPGRV